MTSRRAWRTKPTSLAACAFASLEAAAAAGIQTLAVGDREGAATMRLTSSAFEDTGSLPARFATRQVSGGTNVSIPLAWTDAPAGTGSFAIVLIDRHPVARGWVHWLVIDVPGDATTIPEGASGTAGLPAGALELANTYGSPGWGGPQPPPGTGPHPYETTIYALDIARLPTPPSATWSDVSAAMSGHVLASASITGTFGR